MAQPRAPQPRGWAGQPGELPLQNGAPVPQSWLQEELVQSQCVRGAAAARQSVPRTQAASNKQHQSRGQRAGSEVLPAVATGLAMYSPPRDLGAVGGRCRGRLRPSRAGLWLLVRLAARERAGAEWQGQAGGAPGGIFSLPGSCSHAVVGKWVSRWLVSAPRAGSWAG